MIFKWHVKALLSCIYAPWESFLHCHYLYPLLVFHNHNITHLSSVCYTESVVISTVCDILWLLSDKSSICRFSLHCAPASYYSLYLFWKRQVPPRTWKLPAISLSICRQLFVYIYIYIYIHIQINISRTERQRGVRALPSWSYSFKAIFSEMNVVQNAATVCM